MKEVNSMNFYLMISRNVFFDKAENVREEIFDLLRLVKGREIQIVLVTRSRSKYERIMSEQLPEDHGIRCGHRGELSRKFVDINKNFMLVGAVDEDIRIAANNKILFINPLWIRDVEPKVQQYGFQLNSFEQIIQCIDILSLENQLFYDFTVDEKTRLIALSNANKYYAVEKEMDMIHKYRSTLKYNNNDYKYAVYFHYLTMILGMKDFHDVDYWMSVPSSSGSNENNIYDIAKRTRYLLNNRRSDELFIRYTPCRKSTSMDKEERLRRGCTRHFDTIHLHPKYKGKLKGAKVCVLDDYVTNGTSFETIRNLLIHEGVREIILVAIGTFQNSYQKEEYELTGNLYEPLYDYNLNTKGFIRGRANEKAIEIINHIHDIVKKNPV
jgi:predicted amidophosphoribosyltransferase